MSALPPVVVSGLPNMTPIFMRSWLMKMTQVLERLIAPVSLRSAWLIRRACRPTWESPMSPSISAFGTSAATESITIDVDRAGADQRLGDLQRLLAGVRLRDQQLFEVDAEPAGVDRVEGVLGVDDRGHAAQLLGLGDDVQRQRRLAGRLRAVDLDDAAARHAADAEREVERDAAGRDRLDLHRVGLARPSS